MENVAFVYAKTPILRNIVASHLDRLGVAFRLESELFRIESGAEAAIKGLQSSMSEVERADVRVSRERGSALMAASTLAAFGRRLETEWFDLALRNDSFTIFFQPIVDTRGMNVFAHECLIRLFADRPYNGGEIVEAAVARGSVHLFDSYARRLSIKKAGEQFIPGSKVFINFMPSSIYDPAFCMASAKEEMLRTTLKPEDIVFEVVESEEVQDVRHLQKICDYYRREGFGFALDDVGTGSNSLQMVCDLKPDYIKLDKSLISRVSDPMYKAVIGKVSEFALQFGLTTIAEGIETADTCETLNEMGISLMQGYYFGKPAAQMLSDLALPGDDFKRMSDGLGKAVAPDPIATLVK
jgi:EAL domain-containing protein (putative c-di-GMP-specific phosphodiesterase class I)